MPLPPVRLPSPYGSDRLVRLAARLRPALCDTLITVGSQEFPAHSLVLAGVSEQLGHRGQWALVEGISPSTFARLLYFVYGESIELQPEELEPLEAAARALGVQSLEEACRSARRHRAEELAPELKKHQEEPEKPTRDSERGLGGLAEKQKPEDFRTGGREEEMLQKHKPPKESPEMAGTMQEGPGEQMSSKEEKLSRSPFGHRGADGEQGLTLWLRDSPEGAEECGREFPGPPPPPGLLQARVAPRPWWAEAPWLGEDQPALWSILLLPPRCGTPFSHSTPITGAWQVWPRNQRIPLSLNAPKGLWNQNQVASSSPTPGSLPQGPPQFSPGETEESAQGHTGTLASCVGHEGKAACQPLQHPPSVPPVRSRPYACSVCGKRFSLKHQMETHYRVHTGEKPFSCSLCPQRSRDFSAMTKHLRTHGAAPYRCPLCGAGCPSLASMQAHMRGHSPSQLPPGWTIRSTFLYSSSRPSRPSTSSCRPSSPTT
ncbi:zinc finger and BTB domain-containing protein 32 [Carlito syrichta]|uniref:Zinc finger and BTB domain-containing protein 32 n=1 Tax=Carlito syrichta TaxID=1868482 RepID=A0A1U7T0L6_CARSF|nr:zinc finger and BTB domain-containing protein 32 [Carlito syrichta]